MRSAPAALINLLESGQAFVKADLYTFTLNGGAVLRYTGADQPVTANGYVFGCGPLIEDGGIKTQRGIQVDTIEITLRADARQTVNGVPWLTFLRRNGLDGALVKIERAIAPDWPTLLNAGPTGTYIRFSGRFSKTTDIGRSQATITASSWLELLNVNMPADVYQSSCLNTLYGAKCQVNRASFARAGVVVSSANPVNVPTNVSAPSGYYVHGTIVFTSGANTGISRTIKAQDGAGNLTLLPSLPAPPAAGDGFTIYPGCDLTQATCLTKFNNLVRFRGQPYVPAPETSVV